MRLGTRAASRKHKIDKKCIRQWLKLDNAGVLNEYDDERRRIDGGGRHLQSELFETLLYDAIKLKRSRRLRVTRSKVIEIGARLLETLDPKPDLNLSEG